MLDTDQAWDVFDKLEAAYFEPQEPQTSYAQRGSLSDPAYLHFSSVTLGNPTYRHHLKNIVTFWEYLTQTN